MVFSESIIDIGLNLKKCLGWFLQSWKGSSEKMKKRRVRCQGLLPSPNSWNASLILLELSVFKSKIASRFQSSFKSKISLKKLLMKKHLWGLKGPQIRKTKQKIVIPSHGWCWIVHRFIQLSIKAKIFQSLWSRVLWKEYMNPK